MIFLVLTFVFSCYCWGHDGHTMIAGIAQNFLTSRTMSNMKPILNGQTIVYYAPKPDDYDHCPGGEWSQPMHFLNCDTDTCSLTRDCTPFCVWRAMLNYSARLNETDKPCNAPSHCSSHDNPEPCPLEYLIHFAGDIHCPVHVVNSHVFPKGGSKMIVEISFRRGKKPENGSIHWVWDDVIIFETVDRDYGGSFDKYTSSMIQQLTADGNKLLNEYQVAKDDFEVYVKETMTSSNDHAAKYDHTTNLIDEKYYQENKDVVTVQLMKSGARLAYLLNEFFGK